MSSLDKKKSVPCSYQRKKKKKFGMASFLKIDVIVYEEGKITKGREVEVPFADMITKAWVTVIFMLPKYIEILKIYQT